MKKALFIGLLLFWMNVQANPTADEVYELKKKALYYEIKAKLQAGEITIEQAQKIWQKKIKKLNKEEGK